MSAIVKLQTPITLGTKLPLLCLDQAADEMAVFFLGNVVAFSRAACLFLHPVQG